MDLNRPAVAHLPVTEASQVGGARRTAIGLASASGLDQTRTAGVGIVVSELATNLLKHAGGGELLLQRRTGGGVDVLEAVAYDRGPGMANVERCLADGFSTAGSSGTGLGAARRLSDTFDAYSRPGAGAIVLARWHLPADTGPPAIRWGALSRPIAGETACGDAWAVSATSGIASFMIADGLGHGPDAAVAARAVVGAFLQDAAAAPQRMMELANRAANGTRGAAAAMAQWRRATGQLAFAGVGNIEASIRTPGGSRGMMSYGGIVGLQPRPVRTLEHAWPPGALLVMHSDGIRSRWSLGDYPGIDLRDPMIIAVALLRDCVRGRDDVSVLVARQAEALDG